MSRSWIALIVLAATMGILASAISVGNAREDQRRREHARVWSLIKKQRCEEYVAIRRAKPDYFVTFDSCMEMLCEKELKQ